METMENLENLMKPEKEDDVNGGGGEEKEKEKRGAFEYFGWVYHLGINKIGHEYHHLRFLFIRGKYVEMYKRDPHEHPGIKPIRRGVVGPTLVVENRGCRKVSHSDVYVLQFYNRLDERTKGEIACATEEEVQKWMEAFDHAKQQGEFELSQGVCARNKLNMENEIDLHGHRPRVRRYANGLKRLIRIGGQGPETLMRQSSCTHVSEDGCYAGDIEDAIDPHEWKCVRTVNGVRIFEDVSSAKNDKGILVKAVGVIEASADATFEMLMSLDRHHRYEWDMLTSDLELIDSYDGNYDVLYGTYDPKYLTRWQSNRDFVFSRQWFRAQDGTYTILFFPIVYKKRPPRSGYRRTKLRPSTWEIRNLNTPMGSNIVRCLAIEMLEIQEGGWRAWKQKPSSKFEKTISYALLSQVAGLKEYIGANPHQMSESSLFPPTTPRGSMSAFEYEEEQVQDEFYDAIASCASSSSSDNDEDDEGGEEDKETKAKKAASSLSSKQTPVLDTNKELDANEPPFPIDQSQFSCSLPMGKDDNDSNCWTSPSGEGFKIRGKNYLKDNSKVVGGDPLLKLISVDWFKTDKAIDKIALHPKSLVQTEAGKKLPFLLVINLQVPAKPNYNLVIYFASDRPVNESSLLGRFIDGTDEFRDSRFKLIPRIVEGYWMVKRAVGTKACLMGKAVTCRYLRQDNFLEIDVDIASSSVARSVIGLVLGYVTTLVVDLAILIEAKEKDELPEYILGTVRLNRVKIDSAQSL